VQPPRSRISLPPPASLREEARRVGRRMDRDGRPRKRFLSQRRQQLASALVPNLGAMAAACAAFALIDLFGLGASTHAIVPEAAAALALGGCAMAAALLGRNLAALTVLSVMGPCVALLASAWIVRVTGGDGGPVAILVALFVVLPWLSSQLHQNSSSSVKSTSYLRELHRRSSSANQPHESVPMPPGHRDRG